MSPETTVELIHRMSVEKRICPTVKEMRAIGKITPILTETPDLTRMRVRQEVLLETQTNEAGQKRVARHEYLLAPGLRTIHRMEEILSPSPRLGRPWRTL
jgi:hypothetical protein